MTSPLIDEYADVFSGLGAMPDEHSIAVDTSVRPVIQIPTFDDVISELNGKRMFTIIDMRDGFWQVKLDDASSKLCTFNTPFGRYSYLRLPFDATPAIGGIGGGLVGGADASARRGARGNDVGAAEVGDDVICAVGNGCGRQSKPPSPNQHKGDASRLPSTAVADSTNDVIADFRRADVITSGTSSS